MKDKSYEEQPEKLLGNMGLQCSDRADLVAADEKIRPCKIIDFAVRGDSKLWCHKLWK